MKVDESVYSTLKEAMSYTNNNYDIKWFDKDMIEGYIEEDEILEIIEDLCYQVDKWKYKFEDLESDVIDNYRRIPVREQYEDSEHNYYD